MTLLQMKAVILAIETGSISLAAKQLNISQSNASAYIKEVEEELGVQLLIRNRKGIVPTEQGNEFIEHAKNIFDEQEAINNINKLRKFHRLRVGAMHSNPASVVFKEIAIEHINDENIDFEYTNVSLLKGMELLKTHKIDILVGFIRDDLIQKVDWTLETYGLEKTKLSTFKPYIRVRKNHPLLKDGVNANGSIKQKALINYQYIDYSAFKDDDLSLLFYNNFSSGGVHKIFVNDETVRNEIISRSDAFCMSSKLVKEKADALGIVSIPVDNLTAEYCVITRINENKTDIIRDYIERLKNLSGYYSGK